MQKELLYRSFLVTLQFMINTANKKSRGGIIARILLSLILCPVILIAALMVVLHLPAVQNYAISRVCEIAKDELGYDVEIRNFRLSFPLKVTINGEYSAFYYSLYSGDVADSEAYPDDMFYASLEYGQSRLSTNLVVKYDTPMTFVAVAYDAANNPTKLYRDKLIFTQDGASPAKDYIASLKKSQVSLLSASEDFHQAAPVTVRKPAENRISSEQLEAKHQEAMAKVQQMRKDKAVEKFESAKMRKLKHIAR